MAQDPSHGSEPPAEGSGGPSGPEILARRLPLQVVPPLHSPTDRRRGPRAPAAGEARASHVSPRARASQVFHRDRAYWGLAANVHFLTVALNHALMLNRTLITAK